MLLCRVSHLWNCRQAGEVLPQGGSRERQTDRRSDRQPQRQHIRQGLSVFVCEGGELGSIYLESLEGGGLPWIDEVVGSSYMHAYVYVVHGDVETWRHNAGAAACGTRSVVAGWPHRAVLIGGSNVRSSLSFCAYPLRSD